jgi:hypothetical protein
LLLAEQAADQEPGGIVDPHHVARLKEGVEAWNQWKLDYDGKVHLRDAALSNLDLSGANLVGADLQFADLRGTNLHGASLVGASLYGANLEQADLSGAYLHRTVLDMACLARADLSGAELVRAHLEATDLTGAILRDCNLTGAGLYQVNLEGADLTGATLSLVSLVESNLRGATLTDCKVYGIAAWDLETDDATEQSDLVVATADGRPLVRVDDLEVAQFIYLLSRTDRLRKVISTLGSKGVLIIGRFTGETLQVLHAVRDAVRTRYGFLPIMFDFEPQTSKTTLETLMTLAHLSRFVIADLTEARAVVQELTKITDNLRSLPIKLIIHESAQMPSMSDAFLMADSVLKPVYHYSSYAQLLADLESEVIGPTEAYAREFDKRLAELRREYLPWQQNPR